MTKLHKFYGGWDVVIFIMAAAGLFVFGCVAMFAGFGLSWMPSAAVMYLLAACACLFTAQFIDRKKSFITTLLFFVLSAFAIAMLAISGNAPSEIEGEGCALVALGVYGFGSIFAVMVCLFADIRSNKENWGFIDVIVFAGCLGVIAYLSYMYNMPAITVITGVAFAFTFVSMMIEGKFRKSEFDGADRDPIKFNPSRPLSPANPALLTAVLSCVAALAIAVPAFLMGEASSVNQANVKFAVCGALAVASCVYVTMMVNPDRRRNFITADLIIAAGIAVVLAFCDFGEKELFMCVLGPAIVLVSILVYHSIAALFDRASTPEIVRPSFKFHFPLRHEKPATAKSAEELDSAVKKAVAKSEKLGSWSAKGAFKDLEREVNVQWERAVSQRSVIECLTSERFGAKGITRATFLSTVDKTIERVKENCISAGRYSAGFVSNAPDKAAVEGARRDIAEIIRENNELLDALDRLVARFRQDEMAVMKGKNVGVRDEVESMIKNMDFYAA